MIRIHIPGFTSDGNGDGRFGDTQIVTDESNSFALVIDGYCGSAADMLIKVLKGRGLKKVYLYCSHPHYDHLDGLKRIMNDSWFDVQSFNCYEPSSLNDGAGNSEIQDDINYLKGAINLAKNKGISVNYLHHGDKVSIGEIEFYVYRKQEAYEGDSEDPHGWAFLNDGSLCFWFKNISYWTSGDGPMSIYDMCKSVGANPTVFKIPHHGNNCNRYESNGLVSLGAKLCWDNSYSTDASDDFLKYGRRRCIEAGIKFVSIHGDINIVACTGYIHVYKDWAVYSYPTLYKGKNALKGADSAIVADVINNKAGNGNARMTYLLDRFYNPFSVQKAVNEELTKPVKEMWIHNQKGWWYRYSDRTYAVGWKKLKWSGAKEKGSWFLFDKDGYMLTGWQKATWSKGSNWFYFDPVDGDMQTGWILVKGCWYYLDPTDGFMVIGWVTYKGKKCYLDPVSGKAYRNCIKTIDGKTYSFDDGCYATEYNGTISTVSGKINNLSESRKQFVLAVAEYVRKYAPQYDIKVCSPIIAQAIHESGWGESSLAAKYHNYFGLKCGTLWTGKSVNLSTKEEYSAGTLTTIKAFFRVYDSLEEGIKGYFDFIQLPRYSNLKGVTDPQTYLENIKNDGYATGSQYVTHNMTLINEYSLTQFDFLDAETSRDTKTTDRRNAIITLANSKVGIQEGSDKHHEIIDVYNAYGAENGYPRGYKVKYTDSWCATFISYLGISLGYTDVIPVECGCPQMITLAKDMGEWVESDSYVPSPGDIILYDWQDSGSGDNTGTPDHIGIVVSLSGNNFNVVEGNYKDSVAVRTMTVNGKNIRGYIVPKY